MATDGFVAVSPDSSGKKIDTSELTSAAGNVVERQRTVEGDPNFAGNLTNVTIDGEQWVGGPRMSDILTAIAVELRVHSIYLQMIANSQDDPESFRRDPSFQP